MENLIGKKFGRLTVHKLAKPNILPSGEKVTMWLCRCDCGKEKSVSAHNLKSGKTKSCGCLSAELARKRRTTHGATANRKRDRIYDIWRAMKERCYNPNNISYKNYGGRGICVCDEWINNYPSFRDWAISSGYKDDLSIDRIDCEKDYSPENCRWASRKQQNNNTRHNTIIFAFGKSQTLSQWSEEVGLSTDVISARIKRLGWSAEDALSKPLRGKSK